MTALAVSEHRSDRRRRAQLRLINISETTPSTREWGLTEEPQPFVVDLRRVSGDTSSAVSAGDPWRDVVLDGVNRINAVLSASFADFAPESAIAAAMQPSFNAFNEVMANVAAGVFQAQANSIRESVRAIQAQMFNQMQPALAAALAANTSLRTMANWQVTPLIPLSNVAGQLRPIPASALPPDMLLSRSVAVPTSPEVEEERDALDATEQDPPAYRAFCELRRWLSLSARETAEMLGLGGTTPYTWKRESREPHPANARAVYQAHALVEAVFQRLGESDARSWIFSGNPSPFELLSHGDIEAATNAAQTMIFGRPTAEPESGALYEERVETSSPQVQQNAPRPRRAATRRIRRSAT